MELFSLVVGSSSLTDNASVSAVVNPLRLKGSLSIYNSDTLHTNGLNVWIGGDFANRGTYKAFSAALVPNTTTFSGTSQAILTLHTSTTFGHLTLAKTAANGSITFMGNAPLRTIAGNLILTNGTLHDGGQVISVQGIF